MPKFGVDIIAQAIPSKPIRNGSRITNVNIQGNISVLPPPAGHNRVPIPSGVEANLNFRFDDINYYSS